MLLLENHSFFISGRWLRGRKAEKGTERFYFLVPYIINSQHLYNQLDPRGVAHHSVSYIDEKRVCRLR